MVVGENGILNRATDASKKTQSASEKEALEFILTEMRIDSYTNKENEYKYGEKLLDKKVGNSNWKVVVKGDNVYGTGWSFLQKGTEIDSLGILEKNWLINYETGECLELEDGTYNMMSATDAMAVDDHIILNLDSTVIDGNISNTQKDLENVLGNGVKLNGFDYNNSSGLTNTSFKFDGVNDYISIPLDDKNLFFDNGFTLEFYGIFDGPGSERTADGTVYQREEEYIHDGASGIFQVVDNSNGKNIPLQLVSEKYDNDFAQINWRIGSTLRQAAEGLGRKSAVMIRMEERVLGQGSYLKNMILK